MPAESAWNRLAYWGATLTRTLVPPKNARPLVVIGDVRVEARERHADLACARTLTALALAALSGSHATVVRAKGRPGELARRLVAQGVSAWRLGSVDPVWIDDVVPAATERPLIRANRIHADLLGCLPGDIHWSSTVAASRPSRHEDPLKTKFSLASCTDAG